MFENVLMLAGLGGAVVPLVIHLLARARYRTVDWGAMMFLDGAAPRYRDGGRLREWALLGVRMAAVALLATAALGRQDRVARQLYVICDRQAVSWRNARPANLLSPSQPPSPPPKLARFVVIPVGGRETDNVAIDSIDLLNPPAVRGAPDEV